jgi:hypothetical protein
MASFEEIEERLLNLEQGRLQVKDLPLAALQRKLEQDWQPDAGILFGQGLARGGVDSLVYVASTLSGTLLVRHGLGRVPSAVVATAFNSPAVDQVPLCNTYTWTADSFSINGELDAAYTGSIQFAWIAL